ncbi:MAG: ABC transporter substrate-binding protein [Clostridia bacterium]|nr:ABC transporter substrate-binding protein [Clostridia bacterium]
MKLRIFSLALALLMLLPLAACNAKKDPVEINVYTLNGTTGFGMAKMMSDAKTATDATEKYTFTVKTDASDVTAALINGDADIAALPTNAAANVYQKTNGGVEILAVNTMGCLYLLTTDGSTVSSFEDLRGKTVYAPAQNPTFILKYLCQENGLTVGTDVIIDNQYAQPAALKDAVANGSVAIAVLPEPMVTIATNAGKQNNVTVTNAMDLTAEWNKVTTKDTLVQGCVVVRKEFLQENPEAVKNFLTAYEASINYLSTNLDDAAQMIVDNGIFTSAPVAKKAIPHCNICYLDGEDMKTAMKNYLTILHSIAPASVGGSLPGDDFYYDAK